MGDRAAPEEPRRVEFDEVANALDREVRRRQGGDDRPVVREASTAHEHRGDARVPDVLYGGKDALLVVDDDVMRRRVSAFDVLERRLLVDIDEHVSAHGGGEAGVLDLARLEHDV